jgi:hypothetical protein
MRAGTRGEVLGLCISRGTILHDPRRDIPDLCGRMRGVGAEDPDGRRPRPPVADGSGLAGACRAARSRRPAEYVPAWRNLTSTRTQCWQRGYSIRRRSWSGLAGGLDGREPHRGAAFGARGVPDDLGGNQRILEITHTSPPDSEGRRSTHCQTTGVSHGGAPKSPGDVRRARCSRHEMRHRRLFFWAAAFLAAVIAPGAGWTAPFRSTRRCRPVGSPS